MRSFAFVIVALQIVLLGVIDAPAYAVVVHTTSGLSSAGVPVGFEAQLTISGDTLSVMLTNNSPVASLNPNDLLGSYYFDIVDSNNNRPTLTYSSASGDVYLADMNFPDALQSANADLMATMSRDYTWAFDTMDPAESPFLAFGVGTVGNNVVTPNNFMGSLVGGIDYSIYTGDITTANLNGRLLVKDTAIFTFTGLTGFTDADISPAFAFGLGTAPDSFLVPEPASVLLLAVGMSALLRRKRGICH